MQLLAAAVNAALWLITAPDVSGLTTAGGGQATLLLLYYRTQIRSYILILLLHIQTTTIKCYNIQLMNMNAIQNVPLLKMLQ